MKNILVIDTKLMMYTQHHRHKPILGFLSEIATKALKLLPNIDKIIFVKDLGKSKRCYNFPQYKEHRKDRNSKLDAKESKRLEKFLKMNEKSDEFLSQFGSVISVLGIEADDLAYMIS